MPCLIAFPVFLFVAIIMYAVMKNLVKDKSFYQKAVFGIELTILGGFTLLKTDNVSVEIVGCIIMLIGFIAVFLSTKE